jgi:hypothetical protein
MVRRKTIVYRGWQNPVPAIEKEDGYESDDCEDPKLHTRPDDLAIHGRIDPGRRSLKPALYVSRRCGRQGAVQIRVPGIMIILSGRRALEYLLI